MTLQVENLTADQQTLLGDLKAAADIMDAPVNEDRLIRTLKAFERFYSPYPTTSSVVYRMTTHKKDVSLRYIDFEVPHDPVEIALEHGLIQREGHPVEDVLGQVVPKVKMLGYGSDLTVTHGFEKVWPFFHLYPIEELVKAGALPEGVRQHMDYFARHGMKHVSILAVDYYYKTLNVYFMMRGPDGRFKPGGTYTREQFAEMFTDLGFERPSEEELDICMKAFIVYPTFTWDSPEIKRLCVCMPGEKPSDIPHQMHPLTQRFVEEVPMRGERTAYTFCPTYGPDTSYLKLEVDYAGRLLPVVIGPLLATVR